MLFTSNKILTRLTPIQLTKEQWDSNQRDVSIFSWASILRFWQLGHLQIGLYAQRSPSIESRYSKLSDIFEFWLMTCDLMARLMAIHVMIRRVVLSKTYVIASALFFLINHIFHEILYLFYLQSWCLGWRSPLKDNLFSIYYLTRIVQLIKPVNNTSMFINHSP